jgi:hypothetical protein
MANLAEPSWGGVAGGAAQGLSRHSLRAVLLGIPRPLVPPFFGWPTVAMLNTTYTLEDHPEHYVPNAHLPVICDACYDALDPLPNVLLRPESVLALQESANHFDPVDYRGQGTTECWCCHTRELSGRHLVTLRRKRRRA